MGANPSDGARKRWLAGGIAEYSHILLPTGTNEPPMIYSTEVRTMLGYLNIT